MNQRELILQNRSEVLEFLRTRYPMFHLSNVFFRDIQYGIRHFLETKGKKIGYAEAESLANDFVKSLEQENIFSRIDNQSWVLLYPAFKTPVVKQAPPAAKPTAPAPARAAAAPEGKAPGDAGSQAA